MSENNDVDLYKELEDELNKSESVDDSGAGNQEPNKEDKPNEEIVNEDGDLSEDEISKLSPRAQKRIREQAEKIKELSAKEIAPKEEEKEISPESKEHDFKDVSEFLNAVQDKDSRKLLETFYGVIKKETSSTLAPVEEANNKAKFEATFGKYEKIDGIGDYKEELKKTFLRNPSQDIDSLFAKTVTDITLNRIKKVENKPSDPNRNGRVNLDGATLEQLYDALDQTKD